MARGDFANTKIVRHRKTPEMLNVGPGLVRNGKAVVNHPHPMSRPTYYHHQNI